MTRLEVAQQVKGILRRSDCADSLATMFLGQGIARLQRLLRVPSMERVMHETAVGDMRSFTIPGDLLQIIDVVSNGQPLDKMAHRVLIGHSYRDRSAGTPRAYSRFGNGIYLWPVLAAGGDVILSYYGTFSDLADDAASNEATNEFPDLLTYAALSFAGDYFRHDETETWEGRFQELLTETQDLATQLDATGGSEAVQSAYGAC